MLQLLRALRLRRASLTRRPRSNRRRNRPTASTGHQVATLETYEPRVLLSATAGAAGEYAAWRNETFTVDSLTVSTDSISTQADQVSGYDTQTTTLIGLDGVFNSTSYRGSGYSVAVIDTGIDYNHPALGGGWGNRVIAGYDFVNDDADPMDDNGHGTHVAGIIGSSDATHSGIAPDVNLIALKVLGANGSGSFGAVEDALQWVIDHQDEFNIVAVNMSLGAGNFASNPYSFLEDEFSSLISQGVFVAGASGNSYYSNASEPGLGYPAISTQTVSVGAVWDASVGSVSWASGGRDFSTAPDRVTSFTQRSSSLDILAPGAFVTNTYLNGSFATLAGTSMATPVIAGAAALLHQAAIETGQEGLANQSSLLSLMQSTGVDVIDGDDEDDNVENSGLTFKRLDLLAAMTSLVGESAPENSAPSIDEISNQLQSIGTGAFTIDVNATDPDGDSVTLTASLPEGVAGASLAFDGSTLTVTPDSGFVGQFEVIVTVSDGELSAQTSFLVTIELPLDVQRRSANRMLTLRMTSPGELQLSASAGVVMATYNGTAAPLDNVSPDDLIRLIVYGTNGDDTIDLGQVTSESFPHLRSVYLLGLDGDDCLTGSTLGGRVLRGDGDDTVMGSGSGDHVSNSSGEEQSGTAGSSDSGNSDSGGSSDADDPNANEPGTSSLMSAGTAVVPDGSGPIQVPDSVPEAGDDGNPESDSEPAGIVSALGSDVLLARSISVPMTNQPISRGLANSDVEDSLLPHREEQHINFGLDLSSSLFSSHAIDESAGKSSGTDSAEISNQSTEAHALSLDLTALLDLI